MDRVSNGTNRQTRRRSITTGEAHCFVTDLDLQAQFDRLECWWSVLSQEEQARAARFRFERDRSQYIASHGFLRYLLSEYLGCEPTAHAFEQEPFGKPRLTGSSVVTFNLSHAGSKAAVVIASANLTVGIDIEATSRDVEIESISRLIYSDVEQRLLATNKPELRQHLFFQLWTRKEAVIKMTGEGMSAPLRSLSTIGSAGIYAKAELLPDTILPAVCLVRSIAVGDGYAAAVACSQPSTRIKTYVWEGPLS